MDIKTNGLSNNFFSCKQNNVKSVPRWILIHHRIATHGYRKTQLEIKGTYKVTAMIMLYIMLKFVKYTDELITD